MPADKPKPDKPDKPKRAPSPPRRKNRFNERELARAVRAARASGASRVDVDPKTGVISLHLFDRADAAGNNPWDEVRANANTKRPS